VKATVSGTVPYLDATRSFRTLETDSDKLVLLPSCFAELVFGNRGCMVHDSNDVDRVKRRADALLSDERRAGSADPKLQAAEILEESDARTADRESPPGQPVEHRRSEETVEAPE